MAAPTLSGPPLAADPPCCTMPAIRNWWPLSSMGVLRRSDPPGVPVTARVLETGPGTQTSPDGGGMGPGTRSRTPAGLLVG